MKELRDKANRAVSGSKAGTKLREVVLEEPIRYAPGDGVERWMNDLLCLDATDSKHRITGGVPHPRDCELFSISRDTLFSYHQLSEEFLQKDRVTFRVFTLQEQSERFTSHVQTLRHIVYSHFWEMWTKQRRMVDFPMCCVPFKLHWKERSTVM